MTEDLQRRDIWRMATYLDRLRHDYARIELVERFLRWSATADTHELEAMQLHLQRLIADAGKPHEDDPT